MLNLSFFCAAVAAVTLEFGCSHSVSPTNGQKNLNLTTIEKRVVSASGSFALDLFGKVAEQVRGKNFFMSPLSVSMALAMTLNGASGQTYDDMQKTLGLEGLSNDEINQSYRNLVSLFGGLDPDVKFSIANSIWYRNTFAVADEFLTVNKDYFDAAVKPLDFNDPGAADVINAWISDKTNKKIPKVLEPPIDPAVVMYLISALYFNGTWQYTFDKDQTKPLPFYLADGSTKDAQMMVVRETLRYFSNSDLSVVELPYGKGDYSMLILLPNTTSSLDNLTGTLTSGTYETILDGLHEADVQVTMPKFTVRYDTLLNDPLISLGMGIAFDGKADFSRMKTADCHDTLSISRVIHSTYIDVNEEGTEAAAVTVVEMVLITGGEGPEIGPILFKVDRPFAFLIKENHENTIMFMGAITEPSVQVSN
ncbi:MAG: hypothetical protein B7Z63_04300 [Ignavibacteriae bacterium 37-53-5]|nr:MAG: hypothetical protein B7Z63_04300 [Ignavibacteriae bacterium 37-53-5]